MSEPSSLDFLPERQLPDWPLMNIVYVILSGVKNLHLYVRDPSVAEKRFLRVT